MDAPARAGGGACEAAAARPARRRHHSAQQGANRNPDFRVAGRGEAMATEEAGVDVGGTRADALRCLLAEPGCAQDDSSMRSAGSRRRTLPWRRGGPSRWLPSTHRRRLITEGLFQRVRAGGLGRLTRIGAAPRPPRETRRSAPRPGIAGLAGGTCRRFGRHLPGWACSRITPLYGGLTMPSWPAASVGPSSDRKGVRPCARSSDGSRRRPWW